MTLNGLNSCFADTSYTLKLVSHHAMIYLIPDRSNVCRAIQIQEHTQVYHGMYQVGCLPDATNLRMFREKREKTKTSEIVHSWWFHVRNEYFQIILCVDIVEVH